MADNFLGFTYKGIHSYNNNNNFKAYIINEGEDLKFSNSPEFTLELASPKFNEINYFLGETKQSRNIQLDILVKEVTFSGYKKFISWLTNNKQEDENNQQILSFDYNPNFGYNVKLASISDGTFYVIDNCLPDELKYNVELTVEFKTIGDWSAIELNAGEMSPFTSYSSPSGLVTAEANGTYYNITNNTNLPLYLNIEVQEDFPLQDFIVKEILGPSEEETIFQIGLEPYSPANFTIFTKYGIALDNQDNSFLNTITSRIFAIGSEETKTLSFQGSYSVKIVPLIREII